MSTSFSGGRNRSTNLERTTDHGQATGKLYHLRLRVECTLFVIYKAGREPMPYWGMPFTVIKPGSTMVSNTAGFDNRYK